MDHKPSHGFEGAVAGVVLVVLVLVVIVAKPDYFCAVADVPHPRGEAVERPRCKAETSPLTCNCAALNRPYI